MNNNQRNGLALAGFLCSIFGLFTCGFASIVGIVLSAIGLHIANETGDRRGLAIAGLVISIIGTVFAIFQIVIAAISIATDVNGSYSNDYSNDYNNNSSYTYYTCDLTFRDSDNNLLMGEEVLKDRPASITKDANGNPAVLLKVKDKDKLFTVTDTLSKTNDKTLVIWSNFDEYMDHFEDEKDNCGISDSHCLTYATATQGFSTDLIITGNYTEEEAKELVKCIND